MRVRVFDIVYDISDEEESVEGLPDQLVFELKDENFSSEDEKDEYLNEYLADAISELTGWCVESFSYEELVTNFD